jgi:hypothetical protein
MWERLLRVSRAVWRELSNRSGEEGRFPRAIRFCRTRAFRRLDAELPRPPHACGPGGRSDGSGGGGAPVHGLCPHRRCAGAIRALCLHYPHHCCLPMGKFGTAHHRAHHSGLARRVHHSGRTGPAGNRRLPSAGLPASAGRGGDSDRHGPGPPRGVPQLRVALGDPGLQRGGGGPDRVQADPQLPRSEAHSGQLVSGLAAGHCIESARGPSDHPGTGGAHHRGHHRGEKTAAGVAGHAHRHGGRRSAGGRFRPECPGCRRGGGDSPKPAAFSDPLGGMGDPRGPSGPRRPGDRPAGAGRSGVDFQGHCRPDPPAAQHQPGVPGPGGFQPGRGVFQRLSR